jgi:hypothetical protein
MEVTDEFSLELICQAARRRLAATSRAARRRLAGGGPGLTRFHGAGFLFQHGGPGVEAWSYRRSAGESHARGGLGLGDWR